MNMLKIHKDSFEFLYSNYLDNSTLFMPRIKNYKGRLEEGYYFVGTKDYMQISFWDSRDWKEKIHNIAFVVLKDGTSFIEISGRDDDTKANLLNNLVTHINNLTDLKFKLLYKNKWKAEYKSDRFLENLESFMLNEKVFIDEFLKYEDRDLIPFIEPDKFKRAIKRILDIDTSIEDEIKQKKAEGSIAIKKSEYTMNLYHNKIQNQIYNVLHKSGVYKQVEMEQDYIDIVTVDRNDKIRFYELKPTTVKKAIREAFGQLMEYSHYPGRHSADELIVISYASPTKNDEAYLMALRATYQLPLFYCRYDIEKKALSELY